MGKEAEAVGKICIADEVVGVLVGMAVEETKGAYLCSASNVSEFIGKRKMQKGIKVSVSDDGVSVEVNIGVEYGSRIRDVAEQVQTSIIESITDMTGLHVASVDVQVQNILMPKSETEYGDEIEE